MATGLLSSTEKKSYSPLLPDAVRLLSQPLLRSLLLSLAGYRVKIHGTLPATPSILALYPHSEHANSFLLPTKDIVYLGAKDYWHGAQSWRTLAVSLLANNIPISREQITPSELSRQKAVIAAGFHLGIYPQGTRAGAASSVEALLPKVGTKELGVHLQPGIVDIARLLKAPLVPIGLQYPEWYQPSKETGVNAWNRLLSGNRSPVPIEVHIGTPQEVVSRKDSEKALELLAQSLFGLAHPSASR